MAIKNSSRTSSPAAGTIRTVAIVAHAGAGKTTLIESLLFCSGAVRSKGAIDQGKAVMLTEPEEVNHHMAVTVHAGHLDWKKHALYFLDTPGSFNFLESTRGVLPGVDGAVILFTADGGIKPESQRLWEMLNEASVPALGFINQIDAEGANLNTTLSAIEKAFAIPVEPLTFPLRKGDKLVGVVDLLSKKAFITQDGKSSDSPIPAAMEEELLRARTHLVERIVEQDEILLERYLAGDEPSVSELLPGLRQAVAKRSFIPMLCGAGNADCGSTLLLDYVVSCLPSPVDRDALRPVGGCEVGHPDREVYRSCSTDEPFSARVLKTTVDPFFGKLSIVRVFSGALSGNRLILNSSREVREKTGHLYLLQGKELEQVEILSAGEIGAIAKLEGTHTGDSLCEAEAPIVFPVVQFAEPGVLYAVEADQKQEEKVSSALMKLADEDPSLHFYRDEATHQMILAGMGQTHIEVTLERLERKFGAHANLKSPKVPYRQTAKKAAKAQGKLKKQTGGHGQFANTWLEITPLPRGGGFEFVDAIVGGVIPRQYIGSVKKGVQEAMVKGVGGYPVVDVRVTLYDGSFHDVDSSDYAFQVAGSLGFKAAFDEAVPTLLEPVMSMRIVVPDDCAGAVIKDLTGRRGHILGLDGGVTKKEISAEVPLAELLDYGRILSGMTSGRGTYTMHTAGYQEVPAALRAQLESTESSVTATN